MVPAYYTALRRFSKRITYARRVWPVANKNNPTNVWSKRVNSNSDTTEVPFDSRR